MGKATHSGTPAEIQVPGVSPELTPDQRGGSGYQPEIKPEPAPSPASPQSPGTEPDRPAKPDHPDEPHIRPDFDPDIPEKPGPPLNDPENPHGKY